MTGPGPPAAILIVEDKAPNRNLLEALLRPEGYLMRTAANGEEALASIAQQPPDLILLDIVMPGIDGYQVASQLKADPATSNIPIIIVTALIDRAARLKGLMAGVEEFLTKPVERDELWLRVRNLLRLKALGDFHRNHNATLEREVQQRTADLQRFRTAMDATADAIMLVNRTTMRFVEVNATACKMVGYTREELFAMGPAQLGAGTAEQMESTYDAVIAGGDTGESSETELVRKDGSRVQVEVNRKAQRHGADWVVVGVVRDIGERKRSEQALRASEAEFRTLAEAVPQIVWITRADGWNIYFNQRWMDYTGLTLEESLGHGWNKPFHPEDQKRAWDAWQRAMATTGIYSLECRLRRSDGVYRWWLTRGAPVRDAAGNILKWFGTCTDIHELKMAELEISRANLELRESMARQESAQLSLRQTEESLQASELRFRQMADNISDVFYLRDADGGRMLYISPAYEKVWGRSRASLYENPASWSEAIHPEDRVATRARSKQGMLAGKYEFEYRIVRPDGAIRWIETKGFPVHDDAGKIVRIAGIAEDITERRLAAEVLKKRAAELERFHRLSVGRELQMIELKKQVNGLAERAGQKPPYDLAFLGPQAAKNGPGHEQTS